MAFSIDVSTAFGKQATERLVSDDIGWLTTINARGVPQPNPVWFLWHSGLIYIYSEPGKAKLINISRNPAVSLNLNTVNGGGVVVVTGTASIVDRANLDSGVTGAYLDKYGDAIRAEGWELEAMPAQYSETILLTPERVRGF